MLEVIGIDFTVCKRLVWHDVIIEDLDFKIDAFFFNCG